jgi:hypothetical protein
MGRSEMEMPATRKMENAARDNILQQKVPFYLSDGRTCRTLSDMFTGVVCTRLTK